MDGKWLPDPPLFLYGLTGGDAAQKLPMSIGLIAGIVCWRTLNCKTTAELHHPLASS